MDPWTVTIGFSTKNQYHKWYEDLLSLTCWPFHGTLPVLGRVVVEIVIVIVILIRILIIILIVIVTVIVVVIGIVIVTGK